MDDIQASMKDLTALLGMSAQALRLYEKSGSVRRYSVGENGYRDFRFEGLTQMMGLRTLVKLGIPLKEAAQLQREGSLASYEELVAQRARQVRDEARHLDALSDLLGQIEREARQASDAPDVFCVGEMPGLWRLDLSGGGGRMADDAAARESLRAWADNLPFVFLCPIMRGEDLTPEGVPRLGLAIEDRFAWLIDDKDSPRVSFIESCRCVTGIHRIERVDTMRETHGLLGAYYSVVRPALEYMEAHHLRLDGDVVTRLLLSNVEDADGPANDYWRLWLPVATD